MGLNRAIILAAGLGTRLVDGAEIPKPLKPVCGVPLIVRILRSLERGGVDEVGVIVGHLAETLMEAVGAERLSLRLHFIQNDEYLKPNGTSLLKARDFVEGPTFVLMSDHLFAPALFESVAAFELEADEAVLGVDRRIDRCFDLEDATKVRLEGDRIVEIGKELHRYDALDTGIFRITPALMEALAAADGPQGCSLSEGVAALSARGKMRVADTGTATWIDVDTPRAHEIAERLISRYGDDLAVPEGIAMETLLGS
ncbi:MAG: NTP transferase domain-containing protein [Myxococcales bacterium]|nr:NTP transferase domain-containing protein [Myxococcales bacterium]